MYGGDYIRDRREKEAIEIPSRKQLTKNQQD
jgi:hypothetical protein